MVDSVSDVTTLASEQIKPAPSMGAGTDTGYVVGLGTVEGRMLILVDIESLLAAGDAALFAQLAA